MSQSKRLQLLIKECLTEDDSLFKPRHLEGRLIHSLLNPETTINRFHDMLEENGFRGNIEMELDERGLLGSEIGNQLYETDDYFRKTIAEYANQLSKIAKQVIEFDKANKNNNDTTATAA